MRSESPDLIPGTSSNLCLWPLFVLVFPEPTWQRCPLPTTTQVALCAGGGLEAQTPFTTLLLPFAEYGGWFCWQLLPMCLSRNGSPPSC